MKNAPPPMGLEPTTVVVLFIAHRASLRHGGLRRWQKLTGFYSTATELLGSSLGAAKFFNLNVTIGNSLGCQGWPKA